MLRRRHSFAYNLIIFILAQLVWLAVLLLWIYWYVKNNIIFEQVGENISPQIVYDAPSVFPFVGGIVLLTGLSVSLVLIFRHLNIQIKLNAMYDNFIANVTHELKSPLSSIQLYLETLNSRAVPEEKRKEFYGLMMRDSERLKNLVNSILEIAAMDKKKIQRAFDIYKADETIKKIILESAEQFQLSKNNITFSGDAGSDIMIDRNSIKTVFDNLVDNSIKYSLSELQIEIIFKRSFKKIEIEFSDNGIGIANDEIKKIFQKFHRIYDKDIPNVKGTGLGLFVVKEIIKIHKGKITAYSEGKGKGSTFKIELPIYVDKKKSTKENKGLTK
ncbi:MAG: HAMP domain-containing histidine kinase [Ignavibacteriaceae bacterium]|nr:HAMP domain-containing histidine kinase [Ignavibacteriaceae bacterium]HMN24286.1 HAMP domain-containing sensor histidine kinase [Ignavibacteriaceae bacterium]HRN27924.1 HAMP domain-containing sensor histidine kinase [Ignavibacteriaceae bacterium]HRP94225.1 HAMP domain-containing sensor histidine kinase [Ignavibacteriaceae bacterium]HRQ54016.1 HAMP domain-containing sensor histidine kinase [Ignavibacteriaceae bacterium]